LDAQDLERAEKVPEIHAPGGEGRPPEHPGRAESRAAEAALDTFAESWRDQDLIQWIKSPDNGTKYEKAVTCLTKDCEALLAFFDFPADHWDHLRTGNPIESVRAGPRTRGGHGPHSPPSRTGRSAPRVRCRRRRRS
jgi:hypothetical protein